jgi:hypothetical protein
MAIEYRQYSKVVSSSSGVGVGQIFSLVLVNIETIFYTDLNARKMYKDDKYCRRLTA